MQDRTVRSLGATFRPSVRIDIYQAMAAYAEASMDPTDAARSLAENARSDERGELFRKFYDLFSNEKIEDLGTRINNVFTTSFPVEKTIIQALDRARFLGDQAKLLDRAIAYLAGSANGAETP